MKRFFWLDIETSSLCNRRCSTCIRNSNPAREEVADWFDQNLMPMETIQAILDQAAAMGFHGRLILSHFNEPLMDPRIVEIAKLAKSYGLFNVAAVTNGDFLSEQLAAQLDLYLDRLIVSLYLSNGRKRESRKRWILSLFKQTAVQVKGYHEVVHWHPGATDKSSEPCLHMARLIINHRGQYLLCCDDMIGHFDLGTFPETSLLDYWYGDTRGKIVAELSAEGGRKNYPYCMACPR